jgi:uncharacterized integral membrane protein (TIGR00698 family)
MAGLLDVGRRAELVGAVPRDALPGLVLVAVVAVAAHVLHAAVPAIGTLLWAMGLGLVAGPAARRRKAQASGIRFAGHTLLRVGVALLGLGIATGELLRVGPAGVVVAIATIAGAISSALFVARRIGVDRDFALLVGTGSGICGASAVAAMNTVARARESDVGYAIAIVTLFGTVAMVAVPVVAAGVLGLDDETAGLWAGASIHEVAQVAGAGAVLSPAALEIAMVMKLTRVLLLAPAVVCVAAVSGGERGGVLGVPGFVVAFLALVVLRSVADLPSEALAAGRIASTALLAAGLAALGLQSDVRAVVTADGLPRLAVGLATSLAAAAIPLALILALM